jgi:hypothetical protein
VRVCLCVSVYRAQQPYAKRRDNGARWAASNLPFFSTPKTPSQAEEFAISSAKVVSTDVSMHDFDLPGGRNWEAYANVRVVDSCSDGNTEGKSGREQGI